MIGLRFKEPNPSFERTASPPLNSNVRPTERKLVTNVTRRVFAVTYLIAMLNLMGCVQSGTYYTADNPKIVFKYKGCHTFGSSLSPFPGDDRVKYSASAQVASPTAAKFFFGYTLNGGSSFVLIKKTISVIFADGTKLDLPLNHNPGTSSDPVAIEKGEKYTALPHTDFSNVGQIDLSAILTLQKPLPASLTFTTPSFEINGLPYPSIEVPVHLEHRDGIDICEG